MALRDLWRSSTTAAGLGQLCATLASISFAAIVLVLSLRSFSEAPKATDSSGGVTGAKGRTFQVEEALRALGAAFLILTVASLLFFVTSGYPTSEHEYESVVPRLIYVPSAILLALGTLALVHTVTILASAMEYRSAARSLSRMWALLSILAVLEVDSAFRDASSQTGASDIGLPESWWLVVALVAYAVVMGARPLSELLERRWHRWPAQAPKFMTRSLLAITVAVVVESVWATTVSETEDNPWGLLNGGRIPGWVIGVRIGTVAAMLLAVVFMRLAELTTNWAARPGPRAGSLVGEAGNDDG